MSSYSNPKQSFNSSFFIFHSSLLFCLPPGGRGTAKRWKEPAGTKAKIMALLRADMESAPARNNMKQQAIHELPLWGEGGSKPPPYRYRKISVYSTPKHSIHFAVRRNFTPQVSLPACGKYHLPRRLSQSRKTAHRQCLCAGERSGGAGFSVPFARPDRQRHPPPY